MIVSRARYLEMLGLKDGIIAEKSAEVAELKTALHRLEDLIFSKNFGVQIYDSVKAEAETEVAEEAEEAEDDSADERERSYLASLARRRSSRLGPALERAAMRKNLERVRTARPVAPSHPAIQHYEKLKETVTGQ